MKPFKRGVFLFHRDLRLFDNTGLIAALEQCQEVLPVFIFDPIQADSTKNSFFNKNFFQCFLYSLQDLQASLLEHNGNLTIVHGETSHIIKNIFDEYKADAFFSNADYGDFGNQRDDSIKEICKQFAIIPHFTHDQCLTIPRSVVKKDNTPYTIFTPFYKIASKQNVKQCDHLPNNGVFSSFQYSQSEKLPPLKGILLETSRKNALFHLSQISSNYSENRDFPSKNQSSFLSSFIRMGVISIREVFWSFFQKYGEDSQAIKELYWRDFFIHIDFHFPKIFRGECFYNKYNALSWENSMEKFEKWKNGNTGFPLVDAGMRELKATGLMHNRVRMVVASFLIKNLHIDWRWGEKYFAQTLIDYDRAVNNGNWQWSASTGCDSVPYFRVFSPISQHKRFDPESEYIKKWVPELRNATTKQMLNIEVQNISGYISPIVDLQKTAHRTKEKYKNTVSI